MASKTRIRLSNGDTINANRSISLWEGKIYWMDSISNSYFVGVYRGDSIMGNVHRLGAGYLQPGGWFGRWELRRVSDKKF